MGKKSFHMSSCFQKVLRHGKPIGLFTRGCPMYMDRSQCGVTDDEDSQRGDNKSIWPFCWFNSNKF